VQWRVMAQVPVGLAEAARSDGARSLGKRGGGVGRWTEREPEGALHFHPSGKGRFEENRRKHTRVETRRNETPEPAGTSYPHHLPPPPPPPPGGGPLNPTSPPENGKKETILHTHRNATEPHTRYQTAPGPLTGGPPAPTGCGTWARGGNTAAGARGRRAGRAWCRGGCGSPRRGCGPGGCRGRS